MTDEVREEPDPTYFPEDDAPISAPSPGSPLAELFGPSVEADFQGLLRLGRLSDTFEIYGHQVTLSTVTPRESLAVSTVTRPWHGTSGESLAFVIAMVAAAVETIDGQEIPAPDAAFDRSEDRTVARLQARFNWVSRNLYHWTTDAIFGKYREMEARVETALVAMGESSGQAETPAG